LLLKVGVLGHVMPLLFGYDVTHDDDEGGNGVVAATDLDASASRRGPGFLGLSIERSNMQVQSSAALSCLETSQPPESAFCRAK